MPYDTLGRDTGHLPSRPSYCFPPLRLPPPCLQVTSVCPLHGPWAHPSPPLPISPLAGWAPPGKSFLFCPSQLSQGCPASSLWGQDWQRPWRHACSSSRVGAGLLPVSGPHSLPAALVPVSLSATGQELSGLPVSPHPWWPTRAPTGGHALCSPSPVQQAGKPNPSRPGNCYSPHPPGSGG